MRDRFQRVQIILESGAVIVIRVESPEQAIKTARAVQAGGLKAIEVSAVTPGVMDVLHVLRRELDEDVLLGAGTVLDSETVRMAVLAGAEFIVSPICSEDLVRTAHRYSVPTFGGALTPTEIMAAWELGCDVVKVFPAQQVGGPAYIKAILAPLPQLLLAPTGGVNLENATDYIRAGAAVLGVGSAVVGRDLVRSGRYAEITARSRKLREIINAARREIPGGN